MAGNFLLKKFSDIDLNDSFFDSLKADYPGSCTTPAFSDWFQRKALEGRTALVFSDEDGLGAFICLKAETELISLQEETLPKMTRCKISTIKIAERFRGQRLGEGAIGLVLWKWQQLGHEEIYVTAFEKQDLLISQLTKFGFEMVGHNQNGECVYLRSRKHVDYADPYKSFPFINPNFQNAGYLLINDYYHDTMFPYSELKNTLQSYVALSVRNGLSKIYVGAQYSPPPYRIGEPVFIYRIHNGDGVKRYKSCITSFCVVTNNFAVKQNGRCLMSFNELLQKIGNKSVYDQNELFTKYTNEKNMVVIELLYYGYFGEGHNINMDTLEKKGYWSPSHNNVYPALIRLTPDEFKEVLWEGSLDVNNIIIN